MNAKLDLQRNYRAKDLWQKEKWPHETVVAATSGRAENSFPPKNAAHIPNVVREHGPETQRKRKQRARRERATDSHWELQWGSQTARGPTKQEAAASLAARRGHEEHGRSFWQPPGVDRSRGTRIHLDWRPKSVKERRREQRAQDWVRAHENHVAKFEAVVPGPSAEESAPPPVVPTVVENRASFRLLPPAPPTGHKTSLKYKAPPLEKGTSRVGTADTDVEPGASDVHSHRMHSHRRRAHNPNPLRCRLWPLLGLRTGHPSVRTIKHGLGL